MKKIKKIKQIKYNNLKKLYQELMWIILSKEGVYGKNTHLTKDHKSEVI